MALAECPSCTEMIEVTKKPEMGQRVTCPFCDAALEVIWLNPLELDWPYEEDLTYADEDDDFEVDLDEPDEDDYFDEDESE